MYNFIFDIDNTLYQENNLKIPFSNDLWLLYSQFTKEKNQKKKHKIFEKIVLRYKKTFQYDYKLNKLLETLPYQKHIITNSKNIHCFTTLYLLGILKNFNVILTAETQSKMKPYPLVYNYFEKLKKNNNKNIFFEDRIENLIYPKKLGWITVLIDPYIYSNQIKVNYVDFVFPDIYKALEYFNK